MEFVYDGEKHVAKYETCLQGHYYGDINIYYDIERPWDTNTCIHTQTWNAKPFEWEVYQHDTCKHGYWTTNEYVKFQQHKVDVSEQYQLLKWYEREPSIISYTDIQNVCFLGDSQMRNNLNGIFNYDSKTLQKTKAIAQNIKYETLRFLKTPFDREDCDWIVFNVGHWDAGWPNKHMTTVEDYQSNLRKIIGQMSHKKKLIWMTSNPHSHMGQIKTCPPTDWRNLDVLGRYNQAATFIMNEYNIPVWDTFSPLKHVFDMTFDESHYSAPITDCIRSSLIKQLIQIKKQL